ncbi:hypothetical protein [Streptomyces nigrescens]
MSRNGRTPLPLPTLPAMPIHCTHHDTARDLKWEQAQCLTLPNGKHGNIRPFQATVRFARFRNPNAFPGLDDADSVIGFRLTGFDWQGVGEHMWPSVYMAYDAEIRPEHVQQAIETGEAVFVHAADPTTREEAPTSAQTSRCDDQAMQALSDAGAQCGVCGDEPGDRTCPDCERCYQRYVAALRAAGWASRTELEHRLIKLSAAFADLQSENTRLQAELSDAVRVSGALNRRLASEMVAGSALYSALTKPTTPEQRQAALDKFQAVAQQV